MINLILSILLASASWLLLTLITDSIWAGLLPFIIILPLALYLLNKKTSKKFESIVLSAQSQLGNLQNLKSIQQRDALLDRVVLNLKKAYKLKHWQFFVTSQVDSQIGQIYYLQKRFKDAMPYLENAFPQHWVAIAMRACLHFKHNNTEKMTKDFEKALKYNKKIPLLWNLYAWCLWKSKDRQRAIEVLNRAVKELPNDQQTLSNLDLMKNSSKLKMRAWNEQWYQFHLDEPPAQKIPYDKRAIFKPR